MVTALLAQLVTQVPDPIELAAEHCARGDLLTQEESAFMFRLRAFRAENNVDDPRRVVDFPKLKLRSFWLHPDPPITRMSVRQLVDTVLGLEWLLLSDVYVMYEERTDEWFEQFEDALELARARAFYLINVETQRAFLDDDGYVERAFDESAEAPEFDYDSDDEQRLNPRPKRDDALVEEYLNPPYRVTDAFVIDMDVAFKSADDALFVARHRLLDSLITPAQRPDLRSLRNVVFAEFKDVKERTAVTYRNEWVHRTLLLQPSYVASHVRKNPHDARPVPRGVLVQKNTDLIAGAPTSVKDIITPPPKTDGKRGVVEMRMNTDAALFYMSASVPGEDFASGLFGGTLDSMTTPTEPKVYRVPALQKWVAFMRGRRCACDSFAAALLWMLAHEDVAATNETMLLKARKRLAVSSPTPPISTMDNGSRGA